MTKATPGVQVATGGKAGIWTPYQIWVVALIVVVNTFNFIDRSILGILQQPIKLELNLTDTQLGMISGPAFGVLYAVAAIPVARWAERGPRASILAGAVAVWGLLTALCGTAQNYVQLALARVGVGVGESACAPSCHSLLSDYFPPRQRGIVLALMATAIPIGGAIGALMGGFVAHTYGWRTAFFVAGLPGLGLSALTWLTLREPARGSLDGAEVAPPPARFFADFKVLMRVPGFRQVLLASGLSGAGIYGGNLFMPAYVLREYGLSLSKVGALTAMAVGVAGFAGVLMGGFFADRFAGSKGRSYMLVPAIGVAMNGALTIAAVMQSSWEMTFLLVTLAHTANALKDGPNYAAVQNMVPTQMRATAAAIMLLCVNAFGGALGPLAVGAISDRITAASFPSALGAYDLACRGHGAARAADIVHACGAASANGLRVGLMIVSCLLIWGAFHFWWAGRSIDLRLARNDTVPA